MNHAFYLVADVTREIRHADIHAAARWKAEEASAVGCHDFARRLPPRPPPLLDVLAHSLRQSEYATKYNTKVDNINLNTPVLTAVEALFPHVRRFETCPLPVDFAKAAKANTSSLTNKVIGLSTFAAAYMAHSILMYDDHVKSHATVVLFSDAFKKRGCVCLGSRRCVHVSRKCADPRTDANPLAGLSCCLLRRMEGARLWVRPSPRPSCATTLSSALASPSWTQPGAQPELWKPPRPEHSACMLIVISTISPCANLQGRGRQRGRRPRAADLQTRLNCPWRRLV